jgi:pyruvate formate lyase activating enzyme
MKLAAEISLKSGGTVKVDWKAWNPRVYEALTGVSGEKALERLKHNTRLVAELGLQRPDPPLLVVSVLLVPLYVTLEEVRKIAEHVASLPGEVPLVLLAFYPTWFMSDLPPTSREHAEAAVRVAREAGVKEVYLENVHLLSDTEYPF